LVERAAERDVEHLMSAADRQDRKPRGDRRVDEPHLEVVEHTVHAVDRRVRLLAVTGGIDVRPAGQHESREGREDRRAGGVVDHVYGRRQQHRMRAGRSERVGVAAGERDRARSP
jgi:hypothetical protein